MHSTTARHAHAYMYFLSNLRKRQYKFVFSKVVSASPCEPSSVVGVFFFQIITDVPGVLSRAACVWRRLVGIIGNDISPSVRLESFSSGRGGKNSNPL